METMKTASQNALSAGEICLVNARCVDLAIQNGADITTKVKGDSIAADIGIQDLKGSCSGEIEFAIASISGGASFRFELDAPSVNLRASYGDKVGIEKCSASINVDNLEMSGVKVAGTAVPDKLIGTIGAALVNQGFSELINDRAGDGKHDCDFGLFLVADFRQTLNSGPIPFPSTS